MNKKESNGIAEMLRKIFEAIFGKSKGSYDPFAKKPNNNSANNSPEREEGAKEEGPKEESAEEKEEQQIESFVAEGKKAGELFDILEAERDIALESGDFTKAYVLQHQALVAKFIHNEAVNDSNATSTPEQLAERAHKSIEKAIGSLNNSEAVKEAHQDYHNHSPKLLAKASKEANAIVSKATKGIGFEPYSNSLNSSMRRASVVATTYMKSSPESPAQKAGIEPTENEKKVEKENVATSSNENRNDNNHADNNDEVSYSPGA